MHTEAAFDRNCLRNSVELYDGPIPVGTHGAAHTSGTGAPTGCTASSSGAAGCVSLALLSLILSSRAFLNVFTSVPADARETDNQQVRHGQRAGMAAQHTPVPRSAYFFGLGIFKAPSLNVASNSATRTAASRGLSKRPGSDRLDCLFGSYVGAP